MVVAVKFMMVTLSAIECHWVPFLGKTVKNDNK